MLEKEMDKARSDYLRLIRLRQNCANENGSRWKKYDEKLLQAEERFHELGSEIKKATISKSKLVGPKKTKVNKTRAKKQLNSVSIFDL